MPILESLSRGLASPVVVAPRPSTEGHYFFEVRCSGGVETRGEESFLGSLHTTERECPGSQRTTRCAAGGGHPPLVRPSMIFSDTHLRHEACARNSCPRDARMNLMVQVNALLEDRIREELKEFHAEQALERPERARRQSLYGTTKAHAFPRVKSEDRINVGRRWGGKVADTATAKVSPPSWPPPPPST